MLTQYRLVRRIPALVAVLARLLMLRVILGGLMEILGVAVLLGLRK